MYLVETSSLTRARRVFAVESAVVKIGRASDSTIVIADHTVSKHHAGIFRVEGKLVIRDLGSRNGTYVNGQRVTEHTLGENDEVRIGTSRFRLSAEAPPPVEDSTLAGSPGGARESRRTAGLGTVPISGPINLGAPSAPGAAGAADAVWAIDRLWAILRVQRRIRDPIELMTGLLNYLIDVLEADRGVVVIVEEEAGTPTLRVDGERATGAETLDLRAKPFRRALEVKESVCVEASTTPDGPTHHALVVPIYASAQFLGAAYLDRDVSAPPFTTRHVKVAEIATALAGPRILDALGGISGR